MSKNKPFKECKHLQRLCNSLNVLIQSFNIWTWMCIKTHMETDNHADFGIMSESQLYWCFVHEKIRLMITELWAFKFIRRKFVKFWNNGNL